jgi:Insertion element 4 transposase N-terminal/Transposase DDE domain
MSWGWESARGRVLAGAGLGLVSWFVPPDLVDEAVGDGLAWEMRLRLLPARVGVYFVLGLCLFSYLSYGQVVRELTAGLQAGLAAAGWRVPAATALTGVRRRVGEKPLESLFWRVCPVLPGWLREDWSHVCGLLAVAWDGTTVAVQDTAANAAAFGKPGTGKKRADGQDDTDAAAFPLVRLVTLVTCGTRQLAGAAFGPVRGKGTGEQDLARQLLGRLRPGMLLLADRNFYSYQLWNAAAGTGAHLLWRARASMRLPVTRVLPDGSCLAHVNDPRAVARRATRNGHRRARGSKLGPDTSPLPGMTVRVIEFTITITSGGPARTEPYRLITTLRDWRAYPAADLAAAYGWRWAAETSYAEFKTYLRGPGRRLRARTPGLARQELWAYLIIYQAIRALITRAAAGSGLDPDRISFTAALHATRRTIITARASMTAALASHEAEILACLVPRRKGRVSVRAVKQPRSAYPSKRSQPDPISHHVTCTVTITPPATTTPATPHQPKHPANPPANPP